MRPLRPFDHCASHQPRETRGPIETLARQPMFSWQDEVTSRAKRAALLKLPGTSQDRLSQRQVTSRAKRAALLKRSHIRILVLESSTVTSRAKRAALLKLYGKYKIS